MKLLPGILSVLAIAPVALAQQPAGAPAVDTANDAVRIMVSRLDLERYKATVKGLTQFGDRRQGTERNRKAVDWIEANRRLWSERFDKLDEHLRTLQAPANGDPHD